MKSFATLACLAVAALGLVGCAQLIGPQTLSDNYSLLMGAESNHPAFIDGNLQTAGETTFPQSEAAGAYGIETPPSEAFVLLPEPKTLTKIVIRSDEILGMDLLIEDPSQGWQMQDRYDGLKGPVVELNLKGIVYASGIKIRVRSSAGDRAARRENVRRGGGVTYIQGETRAPAKVYEIELYGPASAPAADAGTS